MKKKLLSLSIVLFCLAILSGNTLAYFTAEETARNVIVSGSVRIALVEQQLVGDRLEDYPSEPIKVMPGRSVSKIVSVKGLNQDAWVRIRLAVTVFDAEGQLMNVPADELQQLVQLGCDTENWTHQDGWWYCNTSVQSGTSTAPLFDKVTFSTDMDNRYQKCRIHIDVTAQAVQKANNGASALEAAGWPEA